MRLLRCSAGHAKDAQQDEQHGSVDEVADTLHPREARRSVCQAVQLGDVANP